MSTEFEGDKVLMVYDDYVHLWPLVLSYLTNRISRNGAIHSDLMEKDEERGMNSKGLTEVFARRLCRIDSSLFLLHAGNILFHSLWCFRQLEDALRLARKADERATRLLLRRSW